MIRNIHQWPVYKGLYVSVNWTCMNSNLLLPLNRAPLLKERNILDECHWVSWTSTSSAIKNNVKDCVDNTKKKFEVTDEVIKQSEQQQWVDCLLWNYMDVGVSKNIYWRWTNLAAKLKLNDMDWWLKFILEMTGSIFWEIPYDPRYKL